jgi:hypothetical protein
MIKQSKQFLITVTKVASKSHEAPQYVIFSALIVRFSFFGLTFRRGILLSDAFKQKHICVLLWSKQ